MTVAGRLLQALNAIGAGLMAAAVAMGYAAAWGVLEVRSHIPTGFFLALAIVFGQAMTIFYFVGLGVGMREAAGARRDLRPLLEEASRIRQSLALPLGLAIVTLMAAVILGGGSHTRTLPGWAHHGASILALGCVVHAACRSILSIAAYEDLAEGLRRTLEPEASSVEPAAPGR